MPVTWLGAATSLLSLSWYPKLNTKHSVRVTVLVFLPTMRSSIVSPPYTGGNWGSEKKLYLPSVT